MDGVWDGQFLEWVGRSQLYSEDLLAPEAVQDLAQWMESAAPGDKRDMMALLRNLHATVSPTGSVHSCCTVATKCFMRPVSAVLHSLLLCTHWCVYVTLLEVHVGCESWLDAGKSFRPLSMHLVHADQALSCTSSEFALLLFVTDVRKGIGKVVRMCRPHLQSVSHATHTRQVPFASVKETERELQRGTKPVPPLSTMYKEQPASLVCVCFSSGCYAKAVFFCLMSRPACMHCCNETANGDVAVPACSCLHWKSQQECAHHHQVCLSVPGVLRLTDPITVSGLLE